MLKTDANRNITLERVSKDEKYRNSEEEDRCEINFSIMVAL